VSSRSVRAVSRTVCHATVAPPWGQDGLRLRSNGRGTRAVARVARARGPARPVPCGAEAVCRYPYDLPPGCRSGAEASVLSSRGVVTVL